MAAPRQGLPVRLERAPHRGAAFALSKASKRARTVDWLAFKGFIVHFSIIPRRRFPGSMWAWTDVSQVKRLDGLHAGDLFSVVLAGQSAAPAVAAALAVSANMVLRNTGNGAYEIYNLGNNSILAAYWLGQVGTDWGFVTLGGFNDNELSEREQLQLRLAQLDEPDEQPADQARALDSSTHSAPSAEPVQPSERERVLLAEDARLRARLGEPPHQNAHPSSDLKPPDDTSRVSATASTVRRMTPRDDVTINKRPVVIDVVPTLLDARAEPEKPPEPAPQPTEPGKWDESESAAKWRAWREAGNDIFY
jgi:hypothetical protein